MSIIPFPIISAMKMKVIFNLSLRIPVVWLSMCPVREIHTPVGIQIYIQKSSLQGSKILKKQFSVFIFIFADKLMHNLAYSYFFQLHGML